MSRYCVLVTGLPGSGKSTLGREVASQLGIAFLDKDDFLEALFDVQPGYGRERRQRLSRQSDKAFRQAAQSESRVVLASHWRAPAFSETSGTPVDWLTSAFSKRVELFCTCPVTVAASRFVNRQRHPGHADDSRTPAEVVQWLAAYNRHLPLSVGTRVDVDTQGGISPREICHRILSVLEDH